MLTEKLALEAEEEARDFLKLPVTTDVIIASY